MESTVLFKGEADEYASIINSNPISHDDCIEILKEVANLKRLGYSNKLIINRIRNTNG